VVRVVIRIKERAEEKAGTKKKEKIDLKVSTKFQINTTTNGWEKYIQSNRGTIHQINHPSNGLTDIVSHRSVLHALKNCMLN
jgi:hypothetical protein